jgi:hypothetical protein
VLGGSALAKLDIQRTLGVERFSLGPVSNPRFPFVLLDRITLYAARAMNWSHGRQAADEAALQPGSGQTGRRRARLHRRSLTPEQHRILARFFAAARRGKEGPQQAQSREIVADLLRGLSRTDVDERIGL